MKTTNLYYIALLMIVAFCFACDPIEDKSLREEYFENAGTPITKQELQAAISVTQPIPNQDGVVEGDQHVVIKNNRPDIPGIWHIGWNTGEKTLGTDNDTIIYESNGEFDIYYVGISANKIIQTDPVRVTITNCFDPWQTLLTGAVDKADKTAKKIWEFWPSPTNNIVYFNGMYANWLAGDAYRIHEGINNWDGGGTKLAAAGNYTMVFEYAGNKLITYKPDGTVSAEGGYAFTHENPVGNDEGGNPYIAGTLITTTPLPGSTISWEVLGATPTYWLWLIDEEHIVVVHPEAAWATGDFWDHSAWYGFYQAKE
jgi:hypothetical protein